MCSIEGSSQQNTHQRATDYLREVCSRYPGMGFSTRLEWVGEQMIDALRLLLRDTNYSVDERAAISRFLDFASEEIA
jgi:hypothetical protein